MLQMKKNKWFKLDNAAKIFPPTSSKKDPKVFRFSCELKENVDSEFLSLALNDALNLFPGFKTVLKKGLFWYYLETTELEPKVKEEKIPPCSPIYNKNKNSLLFRINYYKTRINLEIYHALSDGTGALEFLKILVIHYLGYKHKIPINIDYDASYTEKMDDSFDKYYDKDCKRRKLEKSKTYKLKGETYKNKFRVIEGKLSTSEMLNLAHKYNASLTTLIVSMYIQSISKYRPLRDKDKAIVVVIPVNLRKYFKSATARNFFSTISLKYEGYNESLEEIIKKVDLKMKEELELKNINQKMNSFASLEHNFAVRLVPLFIKDFVLKIANYISDLYVTSAVSNIGKIDMPKNVQEYIDSFDVFVSTGNSQICICSYLDNLVISFSTTLVNTDIIKDFFRTITSYDIDVKISANEIDG